MKKKEKYKITYRNWRWCQTIYRFCKHHTLILLLSFDRTTRNSSGRRAGLYSGERSKRPERTLSLLNFQTLFHEGQYTFLFNSFLVEHYIITVTCLCVCGRSNAKKKRGTVCARSRREYELTLYLKSIHRVLYFFL